MMVHPLGGPLSVVEAEQRLLAVVVPPLGDYPGRRLNALMWGALRSPSRAPAAQAGGSRRKISKPDATRPIVVSLQK